MTRRERSLFVLSPHARSRDEIGRYKPCGGKSLLEILRDVAVGVSQCKSRWYDAHAVCGFFFGRPWSIEQLRNVDVSLVDCEIYRSGEAAAGRTAMPDFAGESGKSVIWAGDDACRAAGVDARVAESDVALFAYLYIDLCGPWFSRIGEQMARRWGD